MKILVDLLLLVILTTTNVTAQVDESFEDFCNYYGGKFVGKKSFQAPIGDRCTLMFLTMFSGKEEAEKFCRDWLPYSLISAELAENKRELKCVVEANMYCERGWTNLYNGCYQLANNGKLYTKSDAEAECKKLRGTVFNDGNPLLPEMFSLYFYLSKIWLANEIIDEKPIENGKSFAMIFEDTRFHEGRFLEIVSIDKKDSAMVICEKPSIPTGAFYSSSSGSFRQLGLKPILLDDGSILLPTISHYGRQNDLKKYDALCDISLKPYLNSHVPKTSFLPIPKDTQQISNHSDHPHLIRTSAQRIPSTERKTSDQCYKTDLNQMELRKTFEMFLGKQINLEKKEFETNFFPKDYCDSQCSTGLLFRHPSHIYEISDAFRAPLLCGPEKPRTIVETVKQPCKTGWESFVRADNETYCHKYFSDHRMWDDAESFCKQYDAHLAGFETKEEMEFIKSLALKSIWNSYALWIGARRKPECNLKALGGKGFDEKHPVCTRNNSFDWIGKVASNEKKIFAQLWSSMKEPYNMDDREYCGELTGVPDLNDIRCDFFRPFACTMKAPEKSGSIV